MWGQVAFTAIMDNPRFSYGCLTVWVHPHVCGDKVMYYNLMAKGQGSSPRVWGQVSIERQNGALERIIPTRVGTSF